MADHEWVDPNPADPYCAVCDRHRDEHARDDLSDVPTRALVDEARARAPLCRNGHPPMPMIELGIAWWTCPVCSQTFDYPTEEGL